MPNIGELKMIIYKTFIDAESEARKQADKVKLERKKSVIKKGKDAEKAEKAAAAQESKD